MESIRFERLVKSFNLEVHQFDQSSGPIGLLIGLAQQRYSTNRIGEFVSSEFPQVGIYTSPLLSEGSYLFVGVITEAVATFLTETMQTEVFRTGSFDVEKDLHHFLQSEKSVSLIDLKCSGCLLKDNCARCRHTNSPRSVSELEETRLIDEAIECVSVPGHDNKFMFVLDYPELPGVELIEKYSAGQGSNKNIAVQSSTNLRKKLEREGYLVDFHDQIWDAVKKGEFVEVNDEIRHLHHGLPFSFQLVNYVHKATSSSTKLRVISNSSISRVGGSLNENICCGN